MLLTLLGLLAMPLLFGALVAVVVLPPLAVWRWRGGWRLCAVLALLPIAWDVARIAVDTARDPTSHNLFPLEMLLWGGSGLVLLGLAWFARRLAGHR